MASKDYLGELLGRRRRADEDRFFAAQARTMASHSRSAPTAAEMLPAEGHCGRCGLHVMPSRLASLPLFECPRCGDRWLDRAATRPFPGVMHLPLTRYFESFFRAH